MNRSSRFTTMIVGAVTAALIALSGATATPGGLDSSGGHHCWTKCSSYGKYTGQYHCHKATKKCKKALKTHRAHGH